MTTYNVPCPECGKLMKLRLAQEGFTYGSGARRELYECVDAPRCKGTHWAHADGKPFGTPADSWTRELRRRAHVALQDLCDRAQLSQTEGYWVLQHYLHCRKDDHHLADMDRAKLEAVLRLLPTISVGQAKEIVQGRYYAKELGRANVMTATTRTLGVNPQKDRRRRRMEASRRREKSA